MGDDDFCYPLAFVKDKTAHNYRGLTICQHCAQLSTVIISVYLNNFKLQLFLLLLFTTIFIAARNMT